MDSNLAQLAKDILESSEQFYEQFDKNSPNFHKGLTTQVPTGGQRIPESMPRELPEKEQVVVITEFGEEYDRIAELRNQFLRMNKLLAALTQHQEAIFRHRVIFEEKKS